MTIKMVQAASLSALTVILCSLLLDALSLAKDNLKSIFMFEGKRRTYYFFVPDKEGPLPLVVLLHGSGANGEVMANAWRGLAAKQQFTIAAPDSYNSWEWQSDKDSPNFLRAMVEQVNAKHPVDASRIYLFGHSGGAVYALMLALVESEYFAAVAVHAGALAPENYNLFAKARRRIPIAIWVGDSDSFFPVARVKETKKEFESNGFSVQLTILPNQTHIYNAGEVASSVWQFFKKTQLGHKLNSIMPFGEFKDLTDDDLIAIFILSANSARSETPRRQNAASTCCKRCEEKHGGGDQN